MNLAELCIRRPVMTVLLSLTAVFAGMLAYSSVPIAALPRFDTPTITVTAALPGASPDTMASAVAMPLERQFSAIAGLSMISSTSTQGNTVVTLEFNQHRDMDSAAVDVQAALLQAQRSLPVEMTAMPSYRKINPADTPVTLLSLTSETMPFSALNDFADKLIVPTLSTLPGIAEIRVNGQKKYAVRVQVNPLALAARNLTVDDIAAALAQANDNSPVGTLDGPRQTLVIQTNRQLDNAAAFAELIVAATAEGHLVKLSDVAKVEDSVESVKTASWTNGQPSIVMLVYAQPGANVVAIADAVKAALPGINAQLPAAAHLAFYLDRSQSIREAIFDVQMTFGLTVALVILVMFLFLRKPTVTLIPALSLPISLLGTVAFMRFFDYTLDNISLLAITLAVGLVVDDAIVMLENIVRHIEKGLSPLEAALRGSKEITFTILSISISLVAVFIPVFFMPGVIGMMFHEFAAVVSIAVLMSAVVSLTLIPMMASRYLAIDSTDGGVMRLTQWFENGFNHLLAAYTYLLDSALRYRRTVLVIAMSTFVATGVLFAILPKGFFPEEDTGRIMIAIEAAEDISFPAMLQLVEKTSDIIRANPLVDNSIAFTEGANSARMFVGLKPRGERPEMRQVLEALRQEVRAIPGIKIFMTPTQHLRIGSMPSKSRYQYVMRSVRAEDLYVAAEAMMSQMQKEHTVFRDVTSDLKLKGLQARLEIDRDKASLLGIEMAAIRSALYSAFGERQVSTIFTSSDSYRVILEVAEAYRVDENAFDHVHVRAKNGALVPLPSIATVMREMGPLAINHVGQLASLTISFNLVTGAALGDAAKLIGHFEQEINLSGNILTSFAGDAAAFQSTQTSQIVLILAALLVMYVLLGVLYESYIHPITILSGLPSAAVGALGVLWLFDIELSIIAMIGILMLIGIVKKNAILMIDFALNAQRTQHMTPYSAIRTACLLRFRPIMMTTLAAMMGALPIALGIGAGAELRQPLGLAVVGGLLFSQVITLFITPVIYLYLDRFSGSGPLEIDERSDMLTSCKGVE
ncbi:hydrophobic/amphiphilic exporter-1, HAE1 family [Nitrosomonas nitrosa]|uniref:Hydrophobic/amphiphilic exporter-1, HAE1 family n=1 Tax=Nitrosomonas nitrosa TaxID=52442 RepID=A0A1I4LCF9_9PROT|nr:efflux RND transporter permease subunit [Nitrosomonas nitrosa]SFL88621.1 hydrophobic/amphiphilic exporter-1, HAE1 family [Nitrosomonas nitrosa]